MFAISNVARFVMHIAERNARLPKQRSSIMPYPHIATSVQGWQLAPSALVELGSLAIYRKESRLEALETIIGAGCLGAFGIYGKVELSERQLLADSGPSRSTVIH